MPVPLSTPTVSGSFEFAEKPLGRELVSARAQRHRKEVGATLKSQWGRRCSATHWHSPFAENLRLREDYLLTNFVLQRRLFVKTAVSPIGLAHDLCQFFIRGQEFVGRRDALSHERARPVSLF